MALSSQKPAVSDWLRLSLSSFVLKWTRPNIRLDMTQARLHISGVWRFEWSHSSWVAGALLSPDLNVRKIQSTGVSTVR